MRLIHLMAVCCALPIAACSAGAPKADAGQPGAADPTPTVVGSAGRCDSAALDDLAGKAASEAVVKQAVTASGAKTARVVKPGMAVTMDYREDRLTIEVDENNRIVRANCG